MAGFLPTVWDSTLGCLRALNGAGHSGEMIDPTVYDLKAKASTVALLPLAATAGAGSIRYATNARKALEIITAGTGCLVWSDGTVWRTFYDNTVALA